MRANLKNNKSDQRIAESFEDSSSGGSADFGESSSLPCLAGDRTNFRSRKGRNRWIGSGVALILLAIGAQEFTRRFFTSHVPAPSVAAPLHRSNRNASGLCREPYCRKPSCEQPYYPFGHDRLARSDLSG